MDEDCGIDDAATGELARWTDEINAIKEECEREVVSYEDPSPRCEKARTHGIDVYMKDWRKNAKRRIARKKVREEVAAKKAAEKKEKLASAREKLGPATKDLSDEALSGILALQARPSASASTSSSPIARRRRTESEARAAERGFAVAGKIRWPFSTILSDYTLFGVLPDQAPAPAPPSIFLDGIFGRHVGVPGDINHAEQQNHEATAKRCLTEDPDHLCVVSSASRYQIKQPSIDNLSFEEIKEISLQEKREHDDMAEETKQDSSREPNVTTEAPPAECDTKPSINELNELPFGEIEEVDLEKKRESDYILVAEQLPFETLEEIYHKRKRQRTTIDLTEGNAGPFQPDERDKALQNMAKQAETYSSKLVAVKKENEETKEDLEDTNELVQQTTLTADIWQSRFDELAKEPGLDAQKINEIRNRPLSSGR